MSARGYRVWTPDEVMVMRRDYAKLGSRAIATMLNRSQRSVESKAGQLGLTDAGDWSEAEIAVLRRDFAQHGSARIAAKLGRTYEAVRAKAHKLGLQGLSRGKRPYGSAVTDRLRIIVKAAGPTGIALAALRQTFVGKESESLLQTLSTLHARGEIFPGGSRSQRRYFERAEYAEAFGNQFKKPIPASKRKVTATPAPVHIATKGPFAPDAPLLFHPNFKFTRVPAPPTPLRTNTYSIF